MLSISYSFSKVNVIYLYLYFVEKIESSPPNEKKILENVKCQKVRKYFTTSLNLFHILTKINCYSCHLSSCFQTEPLFSNLSPNFSFSKKYTYNKIGTYDAKKIKYTLIINYHANYHLNKIFSFS